jgi:hypothetical protein
MRLGVLLVVLFVVGCGGPSESERDDAVRLAKEAYERAAAQGMDFTRGPCLGEVKPGWVVDVAHDPREDVDDEDENQCHDYDHFVELDPAGNVIRVK